MAAETPWPVLRRGSTGLNVTTVQYLLRGAGYGTLAADGVFGTATETTVRQFQHLVKLAEDGIVGEQTWTKLSDGVTISSTVRLGSTGECVKATQTELVKHFYFGSDEAVDGIFGNATDEAVHAFQEKVQLTADGIVGPRTWRELIGRNPD
jgi:peptidoglycan hydrolase-like protein with peptidoglycan-binding domain